MRLLLLGFAILAYPFTAYNQYFDQSDAYSMALSRSTIASDEIPNSLNNPGSISSANRVLMNYSAPFVIRSLQTQSIGADVKVKEGTFSAGFIHSGNKLLRFSKYGLGYALKLNESLSAGVRLNSVGFWLPDYYGRENKLTADLGFKLKLSENLTIASAYNNLFQAELTNIQDERIKSNLRIGALYCVSKSTKISTEIHKVNSGSFAARLGLEYSLNKMIDLFGGCSIIENQYSFGLRYSKKYCSVISSMSYHQFLGWTPSFSLMIDTNR